eukprot:s701_g5.t1
MFSISPGRVHLAPGCLLSYIGTNQKCTSVQVEVNATDKVSDLKAKVSQARPELPPDCAVPSVLIFSASRHGPTAATPCVMARERSRSRDARVALTASQGPAGDVPDWLADLVPKPSGVFPGASLPSGAAKPLEVPQSLVPMLTESLIQRISGDSSASIILRQDTRNLGYSLVLFSGPNQATQQAREMVQKYCGLTTGPNITSLGQKTQQDC